MFFKATFGHSLINQYRVRYEFPNAITSYNVPTSASDLKNDKGVYMTSFGGPYSTYHYEKGNYFKLANFDIGYNFKFTESSAIKGLRAHLMGQNLFVITNYSGSDPEVRYLYSEYYVNYYNKMMPGVNDVTDWLMTRSFALGLHVTF